AIGDGDACRLLAAVLKRVQAVVAEFGDVFTRRPDAEYATLFAGFWIGLLAGHDMAAPRAGWGRQVQSTVSSGQSRNRGEVSPDTSTNCPPRTFPHFR